MSVKRLLTRVLIVFLVIVIIVLAAIIGFRYINTNNQNNFPPVDTTNVPQSTAVIATDVPIIPTVTNTPFVPVVVTNVPENVATATPEVWYIATAAPAVKPVITEIPENVITATTVPTATPEPVITATTVPTATPEPVITATTVPTATPTPIVTATPTEVPTPVVTASPTEAPTPVVTAAPATEVPPKYTKEALETARKELYKLTAGINEILPDYNANKKYDLYNYISIDQINPNDLFVILKDIYINTLAHSLDFQFDYDNSIEGLEMTFNSACCSYCGKVKCVYKTENDAKMIALLDSVTSKDIMNANMLMLNFLYNNSYVSEDNVNERLIICCSCSK